MTLYEIWNNKRSAIIPPEFGMTLMGSILTFLIVMLICVLLLMLIRCILGVQKEYCHRKSNIPSNHDDCNCDQLKKSFEDLEKGSRRTQPPAFLTVRYSYYHVQYFTRIIESSNQQRGYAL